MGQNEQKSFTFLQLSFMSGRKLDAGYGLFVLRNGKLDMVVHTLPKLFCKLNFIGQ